MSDFSLDHFCLTFDFFILHYCETCASDPLLKVCSVKNHKHKVNYHFKSLDQQLKIALIRLALPLDSHSVSGTSTDLYVSIQQSVCVCVCVCFIHLLKLEMHVCIGGMCLYVSLGMWISVAGHVCTSSVAFSQNTACILWIAEVDYLCYVFIKTDLCHSRI